MLQRESPCPGPTPPLPISPKMLHRLKVPRCERERKGAGGMWGRGRVGKAWGRLYVNVRHKCHCTACQACHAKM